MDIADIEMLQACPIPLFLSRCSWKTRVQIDTRCTENHVTANITASVWLDLSCVKHFWSVHGLHGVLGFAILPSCKGFGWNLPCRSKKPSTFLFTSQGEYVVRCSLLRKVWSGQRTKGKKSAGFLFSVMVFFCHLVFA